MTSEERIVIEEALYNKVMDILLEKNKDSKSDSIASKRKKVVKWLQSPSVNNAAIMRELWHPSKNEEDAKRSYFYKCRDSVLNDDGVPYQFSDDDITNLFKIKSNSAV